MKEKTPVGEKREPQEDVLSLLDRLVEERYPKKTKETARDILFGKQKEIFPPPARKRETAPAAKKKYESPKKTGDTTLGVVLVASLLSMTPLGKEVVARGVEEAYQQVSMDDKEHALADRLEDELGAREVQFTSHASSVSSPSERAEILKNEYTPKIYPHDRFHLSEGEMKDSCERLPTGLRRNIDSVSYDHSFIPMPARYGMSGYEAAHCTGGDIVFSRGSDTASKMDVVQILKHEAGHAADWDTNKLLTRFERLSLLSSVLERVKSPNRYKSWYVEQIRNKDSRAEILNKSREYFAEIVQVYLSPSYVFLPAEDIAICEDFFEKTDPGLDVAAARGIALVPSKKRVREFGQLF